MKPTREFFDSLGMYVYGYKQRHGWSYIGKGNGDRAYHHVDEKDLDWNNCYLLARNLEKYGTNLDAAQYAIEACLIQNFKPELNIVSGRYQKETFTMALFSDLFSDHQNSQRKMYDEVHDFISSNAIISDNVGFASSRAKTWYVETNARDNMYCGIQLDTSGGEDTMTVKFSGNQKKADRIEMIKGLVDQTIVNEGSGKDPSVTFSVPDAEAAVYLWKEFVES